MKASGLIEILAKAIKDTGKDPEIYFDTEAATFDYHLVEVTDAWCEDVVGEGEDIITLKCDNKYYIHEVKE